jgi:hypothetical protein
MARKGSTPVKAIKRPMKGAKVENMKSAKPDKVTDMKPSEQRRKKEEAAKAKDPAPGGGGDCC